MFVNFLLLIHYYNKIIYIQSIEEDDVTSNYYDCWCYLNDIIDTASDNASNWLLNKLYEDRDYCQNKYLNKKGLK